MTYSQVFSDHGDYMLCMTDGQVDDAESFIKWALKVIKRALEAGHKRLLFDNRTFHLNLTQLDVTTLAEHLEAQGAAKMGFRLAVIPCRDNLEVSRMVETAITNRSGSYKLFQNVEEAKAWLLA